MGHLEKTIRSSSSPRVSKSENVRLSTVSFLSQMTIGEFQWMLMKKWFPWALRSGVGQGCRDHPWMPAHSLQPLCHKIEGGDCRRLPLRFFGCLIGAGRCHCQGGLTVDTGLERIILSPLLDSCPCTHLLSVRSPEDAWVGDSNAGLFVGLDGIHGDGLASSYEFGSGENYT